MFIVLEGVDGSGKSTQAKLLFENLKKANPDREVILTREPGGSKGAEEIRKLILGELMPTGGHQRQNFSSSTQPGVTMWKRP